nr:ABC transporter substrate-binding protein [Lachnospiraceae bacterium]
TIGFSQLGSESDWRMASTRSVQEAFTVENGYSLIFNDGQQKQEKQIKAIREFIDQDVDYILLDPCVETGWDSALLEAKEAGIPVIVYDRGVQVATEGLYTAWIGSDFYLEGQKACTWLSEYLKSIHYYGDVNIVDIRGTLGSSAQMGRSKALEDAIKEHPKWHLLGSETGDFTTAKGKEAMESFLIEHGGNINVVYCENDNEAYGAIEAIKNAGYRIGKNIADREMMILSFDSTKEGLRLTKEGEIAVNTECSPLYGPKLLKMIDALNKGEELEFKTYIDEEQFSTYKGIGSLRINGDSYFVTLITDELLESREY